MDQLPSRLLQQAVDEMSSLPGIGKKTALRLVLHLLKRDLTEVQRFSESFRLLRSDIRYCNSCNNISESTTCSICNDAKRDHTQVCVVEDIRDLIAIEHTQQYRGLYHVLGGIISPMDGIGPADLKIDLLVERVAKGEIKEVIMALPSNMEGDTTNFFIYRRLQDYNVHITTIARGISVGAELEYADEVTLGRSILHRQPLENTLVIKR